MNEVWHARSGIVARGCARGRESGPDGENLVAGAWQRLEALPDPRSPPGQIYLLSCLIAVAVCAFTAAGNDRFTAVGQWIRRAGPQDLARLRAPWDPIAGRYRAPDEKTIRVVLDRLDPRALTRALLGPRPKRWPRAVPASVCGYPARRINSSPQRGPATGYGQWPWTGRPAAAPAALTAPGSTSSASPNTAGTCWITLRSTSSTTRPATSPSSCNPLDLDGAVVTFDALHTVRTNLNWLAGEKKAHYIVVKNNQPLLQARIKALP